MWNCWCWAVSCVRTTDCVEEYVFIICRNISKEVHTHTQLQRNAKCGDRRRMSSPCRRHLRRRRWRGSNGDLFMYIHVYRDFDVPSIESSARFPLMLCLETKVVNKNCSIETRNKWVRVWKLYYFDFYREARTRLRSWRIRHYGLSQPETVCWLTIIVMHLTRTQNTNTQNNRMSNVKHVRCACCVPFDAGEATCYWQLIASFHHIINQIEVEHYLSVFFRTTPSSCPYVDSSRRPIMSRQKMNKFMNCECDATIGHTCLCHWFLASTTQAWTVRNCDEPTDRPTGIGRARCVKIINFAYFILRN